MARLEAEARFWSKVEIPDDEPDGCYLWRAAKTGGGYGVFSVDGRLWRAHRFAYTLARGPIPDKLYVLHRCDTPGCIRPEHLWVGTQKENLQDAKAKGRPLGRWARRAKRLV